MKATLVLPVVGMTLLGACNGPKEDRRCTTQPLGPGDTSLVTATEDSVRVVTSRAEPTSASPRADSLWVIPASQVSATTTRDTVQKPGRLCYVFTTMSDTVQKPGRN